MTEVVDGITTRTSGIEAIKEWVRLESTEYERESGQNELNPHHSMEWYMKLLMTGIVHSLFRVLG